VFLGFHLSCETSFIMQIEGSKRWRFSATPAVSWPPTVLTNARIVPELTNRYPWLQVQFPDAETEGAFLELFVKVDKDWQRRPKALDRLGY